MGAAPDGARNRAFTGGLPRDGATPILVHCAVGARSAVAQRALEAAGYTDVVNSISVRQTERALALAAADKLAPCDLYFGCRHEAHDYFYAGQWRAALASGALSRFSAAFSRDVPTGTARRYVQADLARPADRARLWALLDPRGRAGCVWVAGSARSGMTGAVREAIVSVFAEEGGMGAEAAEKAVKRMEQRRKFVVEAWS